MSRPDGLYKIPLPAPFLQHPRVFTQVLANFALLPASFALLQARLRQRSGTKNIGHKRNQNIIPRSAPTPPADILHHSPIAVRIRVMSGRAIRATSRIAFFLCGLISLVSSVPFLMLRGSELPVQGEWVIFASGLGLLGLCSVALAVLPRSLIAKWCKKDRDDEQLFLAPLKWLAIFAAISYLLALGAYLAPNRWNLNPQLMFSLCPLYFVKMTFDPSLLMTFLLLAPMNAGAYSALGLILGYAWAGVARRRGLS